MTPIAKIGGGAALALAAVLVLTACDAEVGSKAWCEQMNAKPKGDWSANQAADYAKHCLFGTPKS